MEATVTLTAPEACEAVRAYLVLRGALPAHGTVKKVKSNGDGHGYGDSNIEADIEIGEAPVNTAAQIDPVPS